MMLSFMKLNYGILILGMCLSVVTAGSLYIYSTSEQHCSTACKWYPNCQVWRWAPYDNKCYLKYAKALRYLEYRGTSIRCGDNHGTVWRGYECHCDSGCQLQF